MIFLESLLDFDYRQKVGVRGLVASHFEPIPKKDLMNLMDPKQSSLVNTYIKEPVFCSDSSKLACRAQVPQ